MCRIDQFRQQPVALALLSVALFWIAGGVAATADSNEEAFDISISGASVVYRGEVSRAANQYLFSLVEQAKQPLTTLVITSVGGDADAGMELGRWVFESQLDVHVSSFCGSSCANYVFPAARRKYLDKTAMLAWHGGATQESLSEVPVCEEGGWFEEVFDCNAEAYAKEISQMIAELRSREQVFFKEIGVDQRITTLGQAPEFACGKDETNTGWYYSLRDLKLLGVENVEVLGDEWTPEPPSADVKVCKVSLSRLR